MGGILKFYGDRIAWRCHMRSWLVSGFRQIRKLGFRYYLQTLNLPPYAVCGEQLTGESKNRPRISTYITCRGADRHR